MQEKSCNPSRVFYLYNKSWKILDCNDIIKSLEKLAHMKGENLNIMLKYTSILKSRPFLYLELKKASRLKLQGLSDEEIKIKAIEENIFAVNTEARKREIASTVIKRIQVLDDYILQKIINGSLQTSKQLAIYSILKTDRLFFEFMKEVYREKILLKDFIITDKDFNIFFRRKAEQSEKIASWKDYTFYKLKQVYKRVLSEAGFIKNEKKDIEIIPQIIEEDVIKHLKDIGDIVYLEVMLGEI
jgi:acetone carboxylase gamma subunit